MKLRNGFVSNSSSSSFIVAVPKDKKEINITITVNLSEYGRRIENSQELLEYFINEYCYGENKNIDGLKENKYVYQQYEKSLHAFEQGKDIIVGDVANDSEDAIERYLYDQFLPTDVKDVEVIQNVER
jgi:hypothetical protein